MSWQSRVPDDDFAGMQRQSVEIHPGGIGIRRENDRDTLWVGLHIQHARQRFLGALRQKALEIDPHQLGVETAATGNHPVYMPRPDRGMKGIRIAESAEGARRHDVLS